MSDFIHVEEFDWLDEVTGDYESVELTFEVDQVGEWIDGIWTVYHDVTLIRASVSGWSNPMGGELAWNTIFGKKQVTEWTEYVREKLDEEYIYE